MFPASFNSFLIAGVGASASIIGLLFVALSLVLSRGNGEIELEFSDRRLAESAFTALANVFFISLWALIPEANEIGYVTVIVAFAGLRSSFYLFKRLREIRAKHEVEEKQGIEITWLIFSLIGYGIEAAYGIRIIMMPTDIGNYYALATILAVLFGAGLIRSWELTGIRRAKHK
jgi:hypothetical protein